MVKMVENFPPRGIAYSIHDLPKGLVKKIKA